MELISTLAIEVNNNRGMIQKDLVQCQDEIPSTHSLEQPEIENKRKTIEGSSEPNIFNYGELDLMKGKIQSQDTQLVKFTPNSIQDY